MAKYWTCPYCEAHLDHGERCSCREGKKEDGAEGAPSGKALQDASGGIRGGGGAAGRIDEK